MAMARIPWADLISSGISLVDSKRSVLYFREKALSQGSDEVSVFMSYIVDVMTMASKLVKNNLKLMFRVKISSIFKAKLPYIANLVPRDRWEIQLESLTWQKSSSTLTSNFNPESLVKSSKVSFNPIWTSWLEHADGLQNPHTIVESLDDP